MRGFGTPSDLPITAVPVQVVLTNKLEEKRKLLAALENFAQQNHVPVLVVRAADLALEEHLTNVINYGYDDARPHEIIVRFSLEQNQLVIEVEDDGKAFNPLTRPQVDTSVPMDAKPIGGLGIHLMRSFMDGLDYRRQANKNILQMRKRLTK